MSLLNEFMKDKRDEILNVLSKEPIYDEYGDEVIVDSRKIPSFIKYHVNEVMKRTTCTKENKPEVDKEKIKLGMKKGQLYKVLTCQKRKIFTYILYTLNSEQRLFLDLDHYNLIRKSLARQCITTYDLRDQEILPRVSE